MSEAADMLAEAAQLVTRAGQHPEAKGRALSLSAVGLAEQLQEAESYHRATLAYVADREARDA